jgi:hypothetical protein
MQPWVDRHPILFVLSDVLFLYFTVSFVVSWWSGWAVLARRFRLRSKFVGSQWRFQSGQMRWLCGYGNCLTVGANSDGLYLSTLPFFPLFHPPLFIPWTEVSFVSKGLFFVAGVRFGLGRDTSTPLWVQERLAERPYGTCGFSYFVESRCGAAGYWMAHDNSDMSSRYAKQLTEDVEFRQEWAEKVGLGFVMPEVSDMETGLSCATCATDSVEHVCIANA